MSRRNYKSFEEILKDFLLNCSFDFESPINEEKKKTPPLRPDLNFIVLTNNLFSSKNSKTKWEVIKNPKEQLKRKLNQCIEEQNFEEAVKLRDQIKDLEKNDNKIYQLNRELEIAIKDQNFERAIEIRDELKNIN